jgi:hypothetical protein
MNVRDVVGFVLIPLVLYLAALGLRGFGFGDRWGFVEIGELRILVAIALLIVGGTSLLFQLPPSQWPLKGMLLILLGSLLVAALASLAHFDLGDEFVRREQGSYPKFRILIEFTVILCSMFVAPRLGRSRITPNDSRLTQPPTST